MHSSNSVAVLTYHSIDDSGSVLSISPRCFADQIRILHELSIKVIPLSQVREVLKSSYLTEPLVVITFDDGFRNVYERGFPILQRYGFTATVFLVTDYCGKANSWRGQPLHIERQPLLGWTEIRAMCAGGITFGSHTRTHPNLTTVSTRLAEDELITSKQVIEDATGCPVETFAYPYGTYNETVKQLAKSHFSLACSTRLAFVQLVSDLFALERLDSYYLRRPALFQRLFSRTTDAYIHLRRTARDIRKRVPMWI